MNVTKSIVQVNKTEESELVKMPSLQMAFFYLI